MSEDALFDAEFDRIRDDRLPAGSNLHNIPASHHQPISLQPSHPSDNASAQQQFRGLSIQNKNENTNRTNRGQLIPPPTSSTNRPKVDPFQSAPFPLAPKNN